jgi:hypothetical protein
VFNGIIGNGILRRGRKHQTQTSLFAWMLGLTATPGVNQNFYDANLQQESLLFNLANLTANPGVNQNFYDENLQQESLFNYLKSLE